MRLNEIQIKNLKPKDKAYRKVDGDGLCLEIHPNGSKYWRVAYVFNLPARSLAGDFPDFKTGLLCYEGSMKNILLFVFLQLTPLFVLATEAQAMCAQGDEPLTFTPVACERLTPPLPYPSKWESMRRLLENDFGLDTGLPPENFHGAMIEDSEGETYYYAVPQSGNGLIVIDAENGIPGFVYAEENGRKYFSSNIGCGNYYLTPKYTNICDKFVIGKAITLTQKAPPCYDTGLPPHPHMMERRFIGDAGDFSQQQMQCESGEDRTPVDDSVSEGNAFLKEGKVVSMRREKE